MDERLSWRDRFPSFYEPVVGNRLSPTEMRTAYFNRRAGFPDHDRLPVILRTLIKSGYDRHEMAQEFGCSPATVTRLCRDYQITPPKPRPDAWKNNGRKPTSHRRIET